MHFSFDLMSQPSLVINRIFLYLYEIIAQSVITVVLISSVCPKSKKLVLKRLDLQVISSK